MSVRVIVDGEDLNYLKKLLAQAKIDEISELRLVVANDGKVSLGANNQVSREFGRKA